jgi:hypothetical protein
LRKRWPIPRKWSPNSDSWRPRWRGSRADRGVMRRSTGHPRALFLSISIQLLPDPFLFCHRRLRQLSTNLWCSGAPLHLGNEKSPSVYQSNLNSPEVGFWEIGGIIASLTGCHWVPRVPGSPELSNHCQHRLIQFSTCVLDLQRQSQS